MRMPSFIGMRRADLLYVLFMGTAVALGFVRTMAFGAFTTPAQIGYYTIVLTSSSYCVFLQLGLLSGLTRELPVSLGGGKTAYAANLVGGASVAALALQTAGTVAYVLILHLIALDDATTRAALALGGVLAITASLFQIAMLRLRSARRVLSFSVSQLVFAATVMIVGIALIPPLGFGGPIAAMIAANLAGFLVISGRMLGPVNYRYRNRELIAYLLRIGLPMMLAGILTTIQLSMDRIFLIRFASVEEIGIYQIGSISLTLGVAVSTIVSQYFGPHFLYRYGKGASLAEVFRGSLKAGTAVMIALAIFAPVVIPLARFVIARWLPDYAASVPLISVFYVAGIFAAGRIVGSTIDAANRQRLLLYQSAVMGGLTFLGCGFVAYYGLPLIAYAYVSAASQMLSFFALTAISYLLVRQDKAVTFEKWYR